MLQGQAVAISRTTGIHALPLSGVSRRKGDRGEIGVTRVERSRTQRQKERKECGDEGKRLLAIFHGPAPLVEKMAILKLRRSPSLKYSLS